MLHLALVAALTAIPAKLAPSLPEFAGAHGKLEWFEGSYEQLLAEAARSKRPIFLDFYTEHCAPCRLMDGQTFSDPAVVEAMKPFLCFPVNGELEEYTELSASFGVRMFPGLIFLDASGAPVDKFEGFQSPRKFVQEVERIQRGEETIPGLRAQLVETPTDVFAQLELAYKLIWFAQQNDANQAYSAARTLIASGTGYDPKDVEHRFRIAKRLRNLGDTNGWTEQIHAIKALDPEGKSRPMRRLSFDMASERAKTTMDDTDLVQIMTGETDEEMLHEGWGRIAGCANFRAQRAKLRGKKEEAAEHQAMRRRALREAYRHSSENERLEYGLMVTGLHVEARAELSQDEKNAILEIAREVGELGDNDTECLDAQACCLMMVGKKDEAIALVRRCMKLEPTRLSWGKRLNNFEQDKID